MKKQEKLIVRAPEEETPFGNGARFFSSAITVAILRTWAIRVHAGLGETAEIKMSAQKNSTINSLHF
jgi:hypothetical protein